SPFLFAALASLASCSSPKPKANAHPIDLASLADAGRAHLDAASAQSPALVVEPYVCGDRRPCRVVERTNAGIGAGGRALTVVQVALFAEGEDGGIESGRCAPYEYWL